MRDIKKSLIPVRPKAKLLIHIRLTEEERTLIQRAADLYAGGILSHWVRYAALHHKLDHVEPPCKLEVK